MGIQKRKYRILISLFCIATLFCVTLSCFGGKNSVTRVDADANVTEVSNNAVAFLNDNGSFLNQLQGAQNEYIYFGTNVKSTTANDAGYGNSLHTGAIKWRVLAVNDTKYGNGNNVLLWADYAVGKANAFYYNVNKYYSNYTASIVHCVLNGGNTKFLSGVTNNSGIPTLTDYTGKSYLAELFKDAERESIYETSQLLTHNYVYNNSSGTYRPKTLGNNLNGSGLSSEFPVVDLPYITDHIILDKDLGSITEDNSGDKLFLLDYEDINNIEVYGFQTDGKSYATSILPTWKSWQDGYYEMNGNSGAKISYLQWQDLVESKYLNQKIDNQISPRATLGRNDRKHIYS